MVVVKFCIFLRILQILPAEAPHIKRLSSQAGPDTPAMSASTRTDVPLYHGFRIHRHVLRSLLLIEQHWLRECLRLLWMRGTRRGTPRRIMR